VLQTGRIALVTYFITMKKIISLFILVLFCFHAISQEVEKPHPWTISSFYYAEYNYRFIKARHNTAEVLIGDSNNIELPKFGFSLGILAGNRINKWLEFKTGLSYYMTGYTTFPDTKFNFTYSNGTTLDLSVRTYDNYRFGIINIPVVFSFTTFHKKFFSLNADLGLHPAFVVENSIQIMTYTDNNGQFQSGTSYINSSFSNIFGLWASAGLNVSFALKRLVLGIGYDFKMNAVPIVRWQETGVLKRYLYSTGGGIIIGYKL
jgi:hypothetical protein